MATFKVFIVVCAFYLLAGQWQLDGDRHSARGIVFDRHRRCPWKYVLQPFTSVADPDTFRGSLRKSSRQSGAVVIDVDLKRFINRSCSQLNGSRAAPPSDTVADAVLNDRLQHHARHWRFQDVRVDGEGETQAAGEPQLFDGNVSLKKLQLFSE